MSLKFNFHTMTIFTREAELPYYAPHGLRHTHANNLANTEIPMKLLSARLSHSTVTTTIDKYSKPKIEKSIKYLEMVKKLDAYSMIKYSISYHFLTTFR